MQIFSELGFVARALGKYLFQKVSEKRDLNEAKTYLFWKKKAEFIENVYLFPPNELRNLFSSYMEDNHEI